MIKTFDNLFYYLENFRTVLEWLSERCGDLLTCEEQTFIERFSLLPDASKALLVRMVMRNGDLFRASKLRYDEIGGAQQAAAPLVALGWIDDRPLLTLQQLFGLLNKTEIAKAFGLSARETGARKASLLEALLAEHTEFAETRLFASWVAGTADYADDCVYEVRITPLCERLRLMFFGNLHQDWSTFVLSDLGIYKYEEVEFSPSSRGFRTRRDVDAYLHLHQCRERFRQGESPDDILADVLTPFPVPIADNDWLESRRTKLMFQLAHHYERSQAWPNALRIYSDCTYPGARARAIRVLERCEQCESAFALAQIAEAAPESEAEKQQLLRILPRLRRKLGHPKIAVRPASPVTRLELSLHRPQQPFFVEDVVREHLSEPDAPVHFVENTLINSLFGLLCWKAIFAAVPGAFFHPFHTGPADLLSADFQRRREIEFAACLSELDNGNYKQTIARHFREKTGIQSPFVFWETLTEQMLELALACLPAAHLKKWFERILHDIQRNRSGLPDLIQFFPNEQRYRMIEVKGPGDRLQDNQIRWLDYCAAHDMPVTVCYVQWTEGIG